MTALTREFRAVDEGRYIFELPQIATLFDFDRIRRERGSLHGELSVACGLPGTSTIDGVLFAGNFNASALRDRKDVGLLLTSRSKAPDLDWPGLVEELCQRVIRAEREGRPPIMLREVPRPPVDDVLDVAGVRLLRRLPVILFGDGGDGKSLLALYLAGLLERRGCRVLYVDWEFAGEDHRDRLEQLFGEEMPELLYVRAERPMTAEADRLRRIVREHRIDYLVADSVAFACDGPPEAAEVASAYFRAARHIGVGSLHVAHTTKAETGDQKPFGSTFWHNGARSTWYVKRAPLGPDPSVLEVALFNRKANTGPLAAAVGFRIQFGDERTVISRADVATLGELADRLPLWQRIAGVLRSGSLTIAEIASELGAEVDSVSKAVRRGEGKAFVRVPGPDGVYRIGLAARTAA